ncbi:MAG: hypothetical protein WD207_05395 [Xanthobacteraceae bacterium]
MDKKTVQRMIDHVVATVEVAPRSDDPFLHLTFSGIFPNDVYAAMLEAMPSSNDYRALPGRGGSNLRADGSSTRVKVDLLPEYIRHFPREKRPIWQDVGKALCSAPVRDAFIDRLAPGLEHRFGPDYSRVGMYPIPVLMRDIPGYRIKAHTDTLWKGITVQIYLPRDDAWSDIGTIFHRRENGKFKRSKQMRFAPNSGYAFAVTDRNWHSADPVHDRVTTRDSILLTYFVDQGALRVLRNRTKRIGNFILNEVRNVAQR